MKTFYGSEIFAEYGPTHLENIDWSKSDVRRAVTASLVESMYIRERDRQKKRSGSKALAPIWWETFHFQPCQDIIDPVDDSIFGSVFEYKDRSFLRWRFNYDQHSNEPAETRPPKFVIALRGTLVKWRTIIRDGLLDLQYILGRKPTSNSRSEATLDVVKRIIAKEGRENVWLAGHSLGAGIALQVGKTLALEQCHVETYLFNPPFISFSSKMSTNLINAYINSMAAETLYNAFMDPSTIVEQNKAFVALIGWAPYLYLNQSDPISCGYIRHFDYHKTMKSRVLGFLTKITRQHSISNLLLNGLGLKSESIHLIPSACIVKNSESTRDNFNQAHGMEQWWSSHRKFHTERIELIDPPSKTNDATPIVETLIDFFLNHLKRRRKEV